MPVGNASSRSPRSEAPDDNRSERWAMPIGRMAGTELSLSYSVLFAVVILFGVIFLVSGRDDRAAELTRAALLGITFWVSGWLMQLLVHLVVPKLLGLSLPYLGIGLVGVEAAPRRWPARAALIVAISTIGSLLVLGAFYRLVEGGFQVPRLSPPQNRPLAAPSIGFTSYDSIWRSAAWLCWAQAVFQLYPLPRTMGRQIIAALSRFCGQRLDLQTQAAIFRRCLTAVALLTVMIAMFAMAPGSGPLSTQWPLLLLLGVLLWLSSRFVDVADMLLAFDAVDQQVPDETDDESEHPGWIVGLRDSIRSRKDRRRLKRVLDQERSEAVDAQRLDDILTRLHQEGIESLDEEDRKILQRVSENLRKQRQSD